MVIAAFLFSSMLLFTITAVALRPTPDEKAMDRRIVSLQSRELSASATATDLDLYLKTLKRGNFGWLEDMVSGTRFSRYIQLAIVQSDSPTTVGTVLVQCTVMMLALTGIVWAITSNAIIAAPVGLAGAYLPMALLNVKRSRRIAAFNAALPECIETIARSLRAGHSLVAAIAIVAEQAREPARTEFDEVYKKQNYGLPFRDALMQLLDRVPSQDLRVLVTGVLVQKDTGGNLAEILDRILSVIKDRIRIQGEIKTHTAQGRLTGWILCSLPIVLLVLINIVNPGYSKVLFTDPLGKKMLYGGVGMLIVGGLVIRQIVNGIEI